MPKSAYRPQPLQWQVFQGSAATAGGLLTPGQLRSTAWTRIIQGVYADSRLDRDHGLSCQAVGVWLPPGAVIAGPSAAYLHGIGHAATFGDPVHVVAPPARRVEARRGVRVHRTPIGPDAVRVRNGLPVTTPTRTAWDVAVWLDAESAVPILDSLLRSGLVGEQVLRDLADRRRGQRGARRAARAFSLADRRAESPPESQVRVRLVLAGLPPPVPQCPVVLPDGQRYHVDLGWPEQRVAVEYDGAWHGTPDQLHLDRRRLNRLVAAGWIVLHVTSQRLYRDFPGIVQEVRATLRSRS